MKGDSNNPLLKYGSMIETLYLGLLKNPWLSWTLLSLLLLLPVYLAYRQGKSLNNHIHINNMVDNLRNSVSAKKSLENRANRLRGFLLWAHRIKSGIIIISIFSIILVFVVVKGNVLGVGARQIINDPQIMGGYALGMIAAFVACMLFTMHISSKLQETLSSMQEAKSQADSLLNVLISEFGPSMRTEVINYIRDSMDRRNKNLKEAIAVNKEDIGKLDEKIAKTKRIFDFYEKIIDRLMTYRWRVRPQEPQKPAEIASSGLPSPRSPRSPQTVETPIDQNYALGLKHYFLYLQDIGQAIKKNPDLAVEVSEESIQSEDADNDASSAGSSGRSTPRNEKSEVSEEGEVKEVAKVKEK